MPTTLKAGAGVASAMAKKPGAGDARLLAPSFALMAIGVLVVTFSYTGDRIHHIEYFYISILGLVVLVAGVVLLGVAKVGRAAPHAGRPVDAGPAPTITDAPASPGGPGDLIEIVKLCCPGCSHVFEKEVVRPAHLTCPNCGTGADVV